MSVRPAEYIAHALQAYNVSAETRGLMEKIGALYEAKLWFQLTETTEALFAREDSAPFQVDFFSQFLKSIQRNVNQIRYASLAITASRNIPDYADAFGFLAQIAQSLNTETSRDAYVMVHMESAGYLLLQLELDDVVAIADECRKILDASDGFDPAVHAAFYRVVSDYHKSKAEYLDYYRNSLLYLACTSHVALPERELEDRAFSLALAALLGPTHNFGELMLHPVLSSLEKTPHAWLIGFLESFNSGNIPAFERDLPRVQSIGIGPDQVRLLREKICLMALIEAIFRRPSHERAVPFADIAAHVQLSLDEVEHLVMKAMSLNLLRGHIDQVAQLVIVSWIQPRVFNKAQIAQLQSRLAAWVDVVGQTERLSRAALTESAA